MKSICLQRAVFASAFTAEINKLDGRTTESCIKEGLRQVALLDAVDLTYFSEYEIAQLGKLVSH